MASGLVNDIAQAVCAGTISYGLCRVFNYDNAFEKAVLATVMVGLKNFATTAIAYQQADKCQQKPLTNVLFASMTLLTIPCTLYAGRVFNFKAVDSLQIFGLASVGLTIIYGITHLYKMVFPPEAHEKCDFVFSCWSRRLGCFSRINSLLLIKKVTRLFLKKRSLYDIFVRN